MSTNLRNLSEIKYPLTRSGRSLLDQNQKEICEIKRGEDVCPVVADQIAQMVCDMLNIADFDAQVDRLVAKLNV